MLGAIVGDILGSTYEHKNCKVYDQIKHDLIKNGSIFTDDSVLTLATADKLMRNVEDCQFASSATDGNNASTNNDSAPSTPKKNPPDEAYVRSYQQWGNAYPYSGYGQTFASWLSTSTPKPYNSWGNGSAMRVSPVGWVATDVQWAMEEAKRSAEVTHNHEEGIKGAQAVAAAVFLARQTGCTKDSIREFLTKEFGYDLSRTVDEIRPNYRFDVSCQGSVPEAIIAFLDSKDFTDAVVLAISLGGDSDTIACISAAIAQAYYGSIPQWIVDFCRNDCMDKAQLDVLDQFCQKYVCPTSK